MTHIQTSCSPAWLYKGRSKEHLVELSSQSEEIRSYAARMGVKIKTDVIQIGILLSALSLGKKL